MILKEFIKEFEKIYPKDIACSWDNVGLLVGNTNKDIKRVLCTLDITNDVIKEAIDKNIDLIISHHPMMFKKIQSITSESLEGKKLLSLIQNDICVYSSHTNLDVAKKGLNEYILEIIDLKNTPIDLLDFENKEPLRIVKLDNKILFKDLLKRLKDKLNLEYLRYVASNIENLYVDKLSVVTGAGSEYIFKTPKDSVFITGDLKHHESLDALEDGRILIDIDHFGSEKIVIDLIAKNISRINKNILVYKSSIKEVFKIYKGE